MTNDNRIYCPFCGRIMEYDPLDEQAICKTVNCTIEKVWVNKQVWSKWALSAEATNAFDQFHDSLMIERQRYNELSDTVRKAFVRRDAAVQEDARIEIFDTLERHRKNK